MNKEGRAAEYIGELSLSIGICPILAMVGRVRMLEMRTYRQTAKSNGSEDPTSSIGMSSERLLPSSKLSVSGCESARA